MRKIPLIAAFVALVTLLAVPVFAADKGAPATLDEIIALKALDKPTTCYVETSVAGTFLRDTREAQGGIGGGCDVKLANLILGAGLRADMADWRNTGSIFAKIGIAINNGATLYGVAEWKVPEWKVKDAGQLAIGAGSELKLSIINDNLSAFAEGTFAATKWGQATKDDVVVRTGIRYRF